MTETTSSDPLTRALLPVLLHKLGNATQLLTGLNALVELEGGDELLAQRATDISDASARVEELGYALAVLGSACGANSLLARREPRAIEILCGLTRDAVRRRGVRVASLSRWPDLAPSALDGWQVPWGIASLVLAAATDLEAEGAGGASEVVWSLERDQADAWTLTVRGGATLAARSPSVLEELRGAEAVGAKTGALHVRFPGAWLRARESPKIS